MPAYYKNTVAELRQICETRGIEQDGLAKPRLIAALREADEQQELVRLNLALKEVELRLKEKEWEIERERMQFGSQSTRDTNVQLPIPSEIYKVLPRMSSNDTDVLTFFRTCERCFKATGVDRSRWHEFMPAWLSKVALRRYMMMSIEECRNYDLVKETLLEYFGQDASVYQTPPPTKFSGRNDRPQCERERAERAAQREKQKQELEALRLKQKLEYERGETERRAREQEIMFNEQCKTLFAVYEAVEHPDIDNYTNDVNCSASKFVDDVFDVMLCDDAIDVSVISDETVTECVNERALLQCNDNNCDRNVGMEAPWMAKAGAAAVPAAAPLQIQLIDLDNADGILQTDDSIDPTGKPELSAVIGDNDDLAFVDNRQAPQQLSAELINFAASDLEGGIASDTNQRSSGVKTNSDSDAAEQTVIREFNQINYDDEDLQAQMTGDVSRRAQLSNKIDAAQMSSASQPQCKTAGRTDGTVSLLTEKSESPSGNYDVNSSVVSHSAAERAAESIGPPVAINRHNLTMAVVTGLAAGQGSPEVLITRLVQQRAWDDAQISGDGEQTDSYQGHSGLRKGVSETRDKAAARGPEQVTVIEPYGMGGPQTVMINGDNSNTESIESAKLTEPRSRLRTMRRIAARILEILAKDVTNAKCKSHATARFNIDQYIYGRIT